MIPISPTPTIGKTTPIQPGVSEPASKQAGENAFKDFLSQINADQQHSDQAIRDLVSGKTDSIQQVVMAVAKAEMSFQLFMEMRNKLIESYNELMRMQF